MNEMYTMSIDIHLYGVIAMMMIILGNTYQLKMADNAQRYARKVRIWAPVGSSVILFIFFTGVVMMAAKHLEFTVENIIMILFNIILIVLERKRFATLRFLKIKEANAFEEYRAKAFKILLFEFMFMLLLTLWMMFK